MPERLYPLRIFVAKAVALTAVVESPVMDLRNIGTPTAWELQTTAASGDPDVEIAIAISADGVTFGSYTDFDSIISSTLAAFEESLQGIHLIEAHLPDGAQFAKFRATGSATNSGDTLLTASLIARELI